jgi:hypothetical protein
MKYFIVVILLVLAGIIYSRVRYPESRVWQSLQPASVDQVLIVDIPLLTYLFNSTGVLSESGSLWTSTSPYWWVNSGAKLIIDGGTGKTIQGDLAQNDKWRKLYAKANPTDTDNGYHPQNIFRLVTKGTWHNLTQVAYFKINQDQLSASPNRNESNGLLLFNRYDDSQNLYYTGIRVDGTAVIKKKKGSTYYTLAQQKIFPGIYDPTTSPNLLPHNTWIGIKSEVSTTPDHKVLIKVYTDVGRSGVWKLVATATDDGKSSGGIIDSKASAGIRTDFMDVEFEDYKIEEIK